MGSCGPFKALSESSRIRAIHEGDFSRDFAPFELPLGEDAALAGRRRLLCLEKLLPLQKLVREPQMRLDDNVEPTGPDETIGSWE